MPKWMALNCRAFEIAGCGGFQLVTHVPVVTEHFEPDSEVATFGIRGGIGRKGCLLPAKSRHKPRRLPLEVKFARTAITPTSTG